MLGYSTEANPDTVVYGPQPFEAWVSEVCEAFGCTPSQAVAQDYTLVERILTYRRARQADALFKVPGKEQAHAFQILSDNPSLLETLARLRRAQNGLPLDPGLGESLRDEGMEVARAHAAAYAALRAAEDDDED